MPSEEPGKGTVVNPVQADEAYSSFTFHVMLLNKFYRTQYISYPSRFAERFDVRIGSVMVRGCRPGSITLAIRFVLVSKDRLRALDARDIRSNLR